jgi:hypothetical protein
MDTGAEVSFLSAVTRLLMSCCQDIHSKVLLVGKYNRET